MGAEIELVNVENRESIFKTLIEPYKEIYDYIVIDCPFNGAFNTQCNGRR